MGERWVFAVVFLLLLSPALAHKNPVIEHTYVSHIWEEQYTTIPRQPVIGEEIILKSSVEHPNEAIEGNVSAIFAVYSDRTRWEWYGGESYKVPDWYVLTDAPGEPTGNGNEFATRLVIDDAGSYRVFVDWYEDGQYIGQSMHTLDVEQRTAGPLFLIFSAIAIAAVLIGVRRGAL